VVRVAVRLIRVNGPRLALQAVRERESGVPRSDKNVAKDAVAVEREAVFDRFDAVDASTTEALVPARPLSQVGDMVEELRHGRVVPVANGLEERNDAAAATRGADGETRE
jgi:hypothetical protein